MTNRKKSDYPELLTDVKRIVENVLNGKVDNAEQLAHEVAENVRRQWGGGLVYISKGKNYELSKRDLQIWDEFTGDNHFQLSRKYNVSLVWVYKIIAQQRQSAIKEKQGDLFEEDIV